MKDYEIERTKESKILNAVIGSTIIIILTIIVVAGIPMWTLWTERQKALAEYEQIKRSNRADELTEKSRLRAMEAKVKRLELMGELRKKYPELMKEIEK